MVGNASKQSCSWDKSLTPNYVVVYKSSPPAWGRLGGLLQLLKPSENFSMEWPLNALMAWMFVLTSWLAGEGNYPTSLASVLCFVAYRALNRVMAAANTLSCFRTAVVRRLQGKRVEAWEIYYRCCVSVMDPWDFARSCFDASFAQSRENRAIVEGTRCAQAIIEFLYYICVR